MQNTQQLETTQQPLERQAAAWIVDRSRIAAESGAVWNMADHEALVSVLRRIDKLVQQIIEPHCGCRVRVKEGK